MTLFLRHSGGRLEGTMRVKDSDYNVEESVALQGTLSGNEVRITVTNPDGTMTLAGQRAGDCRTMNLSMTVDGETHALLFRRK
jgi:hypothetical protein